MAIRKSLSNTVDENGAETVGVSRADIQLAAEARQRTRGQVLVGEAIRVRVKTAVEAITSEVSIAHAAVSGVVNGGKLGTNQQALPFRSNEVAALCQVRWSEGWCVSLRCASQSKSHPQCKYGKANIHVGPMFERTGVFGAANETKQQRTQYKAYPHEVTYEVQKKKNRRHCERLK